MASAESAGKREAYWDNVKGLLIALVLIGHCLWDLQKIPVNNAVVDAIYFFHMPAFVFVSGCFSGGGAARKRSLIRLASAYLLATAMFMLVYVLRRRMPSVVLPLYSSWYLLALIAWRLATLGLSRFRCALPGSVVVALLAGLWPDVDNRFAFARIVALYPFFLAGFFLGGKAPGLRALPPARRLATGLAALIAAGGIAALSSRGLGIDNRDLLFKAYAGGIRRGLAGRAAIYAVAALCIVGILALMTSKESRILTRAGRNSLAIYLLHRPFALLVGHCVQGAPTQYQLLATLAFTVLALVVFGSDRVARALNAVLDTMTDAFLRTPEASRLKRAVRTALTGGLVLAMLSLPLAKAAYQRVRANGKAQVPAVRAGLEDTAAPEETARAD